MNVRMIWMWLVAGIALLVAIAAGKIIRIVVTPSRRRPIAGVIALLPGVFIVIGMQSTTQMGAWALLLLLPAAATWLFGCILGAGALTKGWWKSPLTTQLRAFEHANPDPMTGRSANDPIAVISRTVHIWPMTVDLSRLASSVASARSLFAQYAHKWADDRLADLEQRLADNDIQAVSWVISEVTGSAGSLGDRFICVENGDNIRAAETDAVNHRLRQIIETLERDARAIAADLGIALHR